MFSEFSRSGGNYTPFPDPRSHQIKLNAHALHMNDWRESDQPWFYKTTAQHVLMRDGGSVISGLSKQPTW